MGQGIALDVLVLPAGAAEAATSDGRGEVKPPALTQAELLAGAVVGSTSSSAPGRIVQARFFLIPRRAGALAIPPFRVQVGDRWVGSKPTSITILAVPRSGRTAAFLGGVGSFGVTSRVEPGVVRVGQPVEYQIKLTGPAALGSDHGPDLAAWSTLPAAFQVRGPASRVDSGNPPSRTFRYRLRPMKSGRAILPPIAVAAFDPGSREFQTRYTPSQVVTVEGPPPFDSARVDFGAISPASDPSHLGTAGSIGVGVVGLGLLLMIGLGRRRFGDWLQRSRAQRPVNWRREAHRLEQAARHQADGRIVAAAVAERFARAIAGATRRPVAVLTPPDAVVAVRGITGQGDLANRAGQLVSRLDAIRFDESVQTNATADDQGELVAEAVVIFQAIGRQFARSRNNQRFR